MPSALTLLPIERDGTLRHADRAGELPEFASEVLAATAALYRDTGFDEPWIGYIAVDGATAIGTCGFKSPPRDDRVELAYFTFPAFEGRGFATAMARALVALARTIAPSVAVAAQTLPERNASHRILEKLGFTHTETLEHPEDGTVWEWRLPSA